MGFDHLKKNLLDIKDFHYLFLLSSAPKVREFGFAKKIFFHQLNYSIEKGGKAFLTEATHFKTALLCRKLNNSVDVGEMVYKDFLLEGKKPFENLEGKAVNVLNSF